MLIINRLSLAFFTSILFLSFPVPVNAQDESVRNLPNFLLPEFKAGIVKMKSGQTNTATLNYNIVDQEIVFLQNDRYMVLEDPLLIDSIYMSNRIFVPINKAFYELVMTGPVTLFIQHKSNVEVAGSPSGYGTTTKTNAPAYVRQMYGPTGSVNLRIPDDYKLTDATAYWVRKDNSMQKFTAKRQFLKIFKDKEKVLNQFIDSKRISFKNLSDIVKLFNYCNELYQ